MRLQTIGPLPRVLAATAIMLAACQPYVSGADAQTPTAREERSPAHASAHFELADSARFELADSARFELVDGDRVVLLGSGFIEAAQEFGYVELALTTRWPDRKLVFRNLGWSGDTVSGEARARFTNPPTPYERLLTDATTPHPSVIFIGYGSNVPFEDGDALGRFEEGLCRLLDDLEDRTDARLVLLSPPPVEVDASPAPSHLAHQTNDALLSVSKAIGRIARERGHQYVDVYHGLMEAGSVVQLTYDGIQMNEAGHRELARVIEDGLGLGPSGSSVRGDGLAKAADADRARELERFRQLIIRKNRLYMQQYRPPNETYLVGFRSYEQGQNAGELERLTPLIEGLDAEISRLKRQIWAALTDTSADGS